MTIRASLTALACALSISAYAIADSPKKVDVAAGDLSLALESLAKQTGAEFIYSSEQLRNVKTHGVHGEYTAEKAVTKLLEGTKLHVRMHGTGAILISQAQAAPGSATAQRTQPFSAESPSGADAAVSTAEESSTTSIPSRPRLAQSAGASNRRSENLDSNGSQRDDQLSLEEITVTAQKRGAERLQDVPVPITVLSTNTLLETNQLRVQDYYSTIPGFMASPGSGAGRAVALTVRGLGAGLYGETTVGVAIDDVPGDLKFDIDDLQQVELLRGPQGTLYGVSSLGGLLRLVTKDPSMDQVSGHVQVGTSMVKNGDSPGYNVRASVNVPLTDTLAMIASGFTRDDPGYIDNPTHGLKDVNERHAAGGRLGLLWKPWDEFSLKLNALYQHDRNDASDNIDVLPGVGDLQQTYMPHTGGYQSTTQFYTASLQAKLGRVALTSLTGYKIVTYTDSLDDTFELGALAQSIWNVGGGNIVGRPHGRDFTEELRASVPLGDRIDWLLGGFYHYQGSAYDQHAYAQDLPTGSVSGPLYDTHVPATLEERAVFTNVTFHVTDRFDLQVGGRESSYRTSSGPTSYTGPLFDTLFGGGLFGDKAHSESPNAFTYLFAPSFKLSPDLMVYARLASGFNPGSGAKGHPGDPCVVLDYPCQVKPDTTQNYEVGMKGDFLGHRLTLDTSVYYINWKDIKILLPAKDGINYYTGNAGGARSKGIELSAQARPFDGWELSGWVTWTEPVLTTDFPPTPGKPGDRLPNASRMSGRLAVNRDFRINEQLAGFAGTSVSYIGDSYGPFVQGNPLRQRFPAYARTDLYVGVKRDSWTANLYVNNVTDKRAPIGGGLGSYPPYAFLYIQPRTVGMNLSRAF